VPFVGRKRFDETSESLNTVDSYAAGGVRRLRGLSGNRRVEGDDGRESRHGPRTDIARQKNYIPVKKKTIRTDDDNT